MNITGYITLSVLCVILVLVFLVWILRNSHENESKSPFNSKSLTSVSVDNFDVDKSITEKKDYVTCNLLGGLGNQMFQVAAAIAYGKKFNKVPVFDHMNIIHNVQHHDSPPNYWKSIFQNINHADISEIDWDIYVREKSL